MAASMSTALSDATILRMLTSWCRHRSDLPPVVAPAQLDLPLACRHRRPHLYDLQADKPPILVPRDRRIEVAERLRHDGRVETPLDETQVRAAVRRLKSAGARAIAVCFLYAYVDPAHERRVRRIV